jgi:hypothetical protein
MHSADINLAEGSSAELRCPFIFDRDFWYLNNLSATTIGVLSLYPYGAVAWDTTTVSTPSWTLYRWLEDVEVVGKATNLIALVAQGAESDYPKVSSWFSAAAKVATYAGAIPSLTAYVLPLSWAFNTASKIAAHFGWSKPVEGSPMGYMHSGYGRAINTCADADLAQPMGYYANNAVAVLPGFGGVDVDEMAICGIVCRPGLIAEFPLLATDVQSQVKWQCPVSPASFIFQSASTGFPQADAISIGNAALSGNRPGYIPSPINFVASFFQRWRGDIIFRFRFVRTKFHAGRVIIGYVPAQDPSSGTLNGTVTLAPDPTSRYDYHSIIVDLRTTSEVDFVVPYTYHAAYCDTGLTSWNSGAHTVPSTGVVFMRIIDPLYGPDNVMPSVPVLVEVLAACGMEFSQPITPQIVPLDNVLVPTLVAQSKDLDFDAAATTSGERILSLKQILMRPTWQYISGASQTEVVAARIDYYQAAVFATVSGFAYKPVVAAAANLPYSALTIISSAFALVRGSRVVRFLPALTATNSTAANFASTMCWFHADQLDLRSAALSIEHNTGNVVHLPYYGRHNRTRTGWAAPGGRGEDRRLITGLSGADSSGFLGVAAGDDYQLGAYNGMQPVVFLTLSGVNAYDGVLTLVHSPAP